MGRLDAARRPPRRRRGGAPRSSARPRSSRSTSRPPRPTRSASACAGPACRRAASRRPRRPIPAVPTLLLQGGEDLRTPPEGSAHVAPQIPGAAARGRPGRRPRGRRRRPERLRRAGARALRRRRAGGRGLPPRRARACPPRRCRRATLRRVAPLRGLRGRVGRTAAAIGVTVDDLAFSLSPAFLAYSGGGLRGGSFAVRRGRVHRAALLGGPRGVDHGRRPPRRAAAAGRRPGGRARARARCARAAGSAGGSAGGASRVRLPGYGAASLGSPRAARSRRPRGAGPRRACSARLSSRSRHVRVWFRHPCADRLWFRPMRAA